MWHRCLGYGTCSLLCECGQGGPASAPAAKIARNQLGLGARAGGAGVVVGGAPVAPVAGAGVGADAAAGGGGSGWPTGTIVTFFSTTGDSGLSCASRST